MAGSIGNLAIIISGNARPFQNTLQNVSNSIKQFSARTQNFITINPPRAGGGGGGMGLQWGSFGRLIRSAMVAGFGGGLAGALVGVGAMAFGQFLEKSMELVGEIGHKVGEFLADSFQEGMKLARMELGVNFLAGGPNRGENWMKEIRSLSTQSGFGMTELGGSMRILAGNSDDLENVIPRLRAISEISAGIGADAEQLHRFALAVAQVTAAGRFEAQELNQLTEAGMPIKELANTAGMSVRQFRQSVKDGTVDIGILDQTLNRMALSPGGKFFGVLQKQSDSAVGQVMRVSNAWLQFKQQVGIGIMEGAKNTGWLNAIETAFKYLLDNKGAITDVLEGALDLMKQIAIASARFAGSFQDSITTARLLADLADRGSHPFHDIVDSPFSPFFLLGQAVKTGAQGPSDALKAMSQIGRGGTGKKWADEVAESFKRGGSLTVGEFPPQIKTFPHLSAESEKFQNELQSSITKGISPLDQFQKKMTQLNEILYFDADWVQRMKEGKTSWMWGPRKTEAQLMAENGPLADQGMFEAYKDLESNFLKAFDQFPKAMERGSVEATSAITHSLYGSGQMNVQERIAKVLDVAKKAQEETAANTKETVAALKRLMPVEVNP